MTKDEFLKLRPGDFVKRHCGAILRIDKISSNSHLCTVISYSSLMCKYWNIDKDYAIIYEKISAKDKLELL